MIIYDKFKFENIFTKFQQSLSDKSELTTNPILIIQNSPEKFLHYLENNRFSLDEIEHENMIKIFHYACNMLKEIERSVKITGLKIMDKIVAYIPEELLLNAYIFEKDLAKSFSYNTGRNKFVSIGDYELAKVESDTGTSYGFFAASLEEENKDIKIETLNLISRIGMEEKNKQFAIRSFKYTVELVNDEEDDVRFCTIKCLETLIKNFKTIDSKSCEILFFNLKEKASNLRKLLYSLISNIHYEHQTEFEKSIKSLFENLRLFPEDKLIIFECIKNFTKNNTSFIDNDYLTKSFSFDTNFLLPELNWNDLEYNCKLIILQEYIKSQDYKLNLSIPQFFIKHFNYLTDRYQHIFDKEVLLFLSTKSKRNNNLIQEETNFNFKLNKKIIFECEIKNILLFLKSISIVNIGGNNKNGNTVTKTNNEIYKIIFSFLQLFLPNNINTTNISYSTSFIIISYIIDYIGKINFKLILEDNSTSKFLINFNNLICGIILNNLTEKLGIYNPMSFHNIYEESLKKLSSVNEIVNLINIITGNLFDKDLTNFKIGLESLFNFLNRECKEFFLSTCFSLKITNPKNNFNYIHVKERAGIKFPFFLGVNLKLKNISCSSPSTSLLTSTSISTNNSINSCNIYLARNLHITVSKLFFSYSNYSQTASQQLKKVELDPSNIKLNVRDNSISLKSKIPLYISENEGNTYNISASIKSIFKKDLHLILKRINLSSSNHSEQILLSDIINFIITY